MLQPNRDSNHTTRSITQHAIHDIYSTSLFQNNDQFSVINILVVIHAGIGWPACIWLLACSLLVFYLACWHLPVTQNGLLSWLIKTYAGVTAYGPYWIAVSFEFIIWFQEYRQREDMLYKMKHYIIYHSINLLTLLTPHWFR